MREASGISCQGPDVVYPFQCFRRGFWSLCLRALGELGGVEVCLLCAKSRVVPLKKLTVPKLELQAAVIASRLFRIVKVESRFSFLDVRFFTESRILLG